MCRQAPSNTESIARFSIDDSHELHAVVVLGDDRGRRGKTSYVTVPQTRKKGAVELTERRAFEQVRLKLTFCSGTEAARRARLFCKSPQEGHRHPPSTHHSSSPLPPPNDVAPPSLTRRKQHTSRLRSRRRQCPRFTAQGAPRWQPINMSMPTSQAPVRRDSRDSRLYFIDLYYASTQQIKII